MKPIQASIFSANRSKVDNIEQAFVEVTLGRPSAKCKYFGICKIESVYANSFSKKKSTSCSLANSIFAIASWKRADYFELTFERISIDAAIYEKYFKSGYFLMEDGYTLNSGLTKSKINLAKGSYRIKFTDTMLTIHFKL